LNSLAVTSWTLHLELCYPVRSVEFTTNTK
jgi:hypothetical protein